MSEFLRALLDRLGASFNPELLALNAATWTENLLLAAITFAVYYLLWRGVRMVLVHALGRFDLDETARSFFLTVARVVILVLGSIVALGELGINTTSLAASLGVAGLTIGFAARDALSNIISGVFIFLDRPFVLGDLIEIGGDYGRVARITLRSTRVVTVDGKMLAIPNAEVVNSTVASYTNFPNLRVDVPVTVGVGEDLGRVRRLLLETVQGDPDYMDAPPPEMVVSELNDYNVLVVLRAWIHDERKHIGKRFELRERVFETLRDAGVDMPYETVRNLNHYPEGLEVAS